MYICICNAVTDHDIADAVRDGAKDIGDLEETLLVSTSCGKCRDAAVACLERNLARLAQGRQEERIARLP